MSSKEFYTNLPASPKHFVDIVEQEHGVPLPDSWHIIVTDVEDSSAQLEHYQQVNILAASSVVSVLNIVESHQLQIPFIYGGDGATLCVPEETLAECLAALHALKSHAWNQFQVILRVGHVQISDVRARGHEVSVEKFKVNQSYTQAIFFGTGTYFAEHYIKDKTVEQIYTGPLAVSLDLHGLECKWSEIHPPLHAEEVIALIIQSTETKNSQSVYTKILRDLDTIYGNFEQRHPVDHEQLTPTKDLRTILYASRIKFGKIKWNYVFYWSLRGLLGPLKQKFQYMFRLGKYKHLEISADLMTASDTLKVSGNLMTIFAGTHEMRKKFFQILDDMEKLGIIYYGHSISKTAVMTCYIDRGNSTHINFLDGFGGGYSRAALELKAKIKRAKK